MREIPLTKGYIALVDDADYETVARRRWCVTSAPGKLPYAISYIDGKNTLMHRFLMNAPKGQIMDHINRNGLDNRRENLRFCTYRENNVNKSTRNNVSGFRGVECLLWNMVPKFRVRVDSKHVATVSDAVTGAYIYDCIARIRHGRFARTNFPYRWPDEPAKMVNGST